MDVLVYLFWPNPGNAFYTSPKVVFLLLLCVGMLGGSLMVKVWRSRTRDAQKRTLSRSWSAALLWFGMVGLILTIARVEQIQFVAMRLWWVVWGVASATYLWFQAKNWHLRYYEVLRQAQMQDPREKYLPRPKHKR